jgi:hypothetical protein
MARLLHKTMCAQDYFPLAMPRGHLRLHLWSLEDVYKQATFRYAEYALASVCYPMTAHDALGLLIQMAVEVFI